MHNKQLHIAAFIVTFCGFTLTIKPFVGETIAASTAAYRVGTYGYDYLYNTEESKTILKKHLQSGSYVATGCHKNLSQSCIALANYYKQLENYHKISYLQEALNKTTNPEVRNFIEKNLAIAQEEKVKMNLPDDNGPYLQSLSDDEKNKFLELVNILVLENRGFDKYAEEFTYLYESFNK